MNDLTKFLLIFVRIFTVHANSLTRGRGSNTNYTQNTAEHKTIYQTSTSVWTGD